MLLFSTFEEGLEWWRGAVSEGLLQTAMYVTFPPCKEKKILLAGASSVSGWCVIRVNKKVKRFYLLSPLSLFLSSSVSSKASRRENKPSPYHSGQGTRVCL